VESADIVVTRLLRPSGRRSWSCSPRLPPGSGRHPRCVRGWSVKDVALHLLGDDIDLLSRRRDGAAPADGPTRPAGLQELVVSIDRLNQARLEHRRREWCWTPRRPGGCGPRGSGRTRPGQRSRSRAIVRLAFRSWTPLPPSAKRKTGQEASRAPSAWLVRAREASPAWTRRPGRRAPRPARPRAAPAPAGPGPVGRRDHRGAQPPGPRPASASPTASVKEPACSPFP
jgi:hypothetical protein